MKNKNAPTYQTNPLEMRIEDWNADGTSDIRERAESVDAYAQTPVPMEKLKIYREKVKRGVGIAAVELAILPSANSDGSLKTVMMGWGGNFHVPIARLELAEIARQNPQSDILIVNNPGSGDSSALPKADMKRMRQTGDFTPYGEILGSALSNITSQYDQVNMYGHSMGARSAIATAPHLDRPIDYLSVTDPVGSKELGLLGLADRFVLQEGKHAGNYKKSTDNKAALRLQNDYDAAAIEKKPMTAERLRALKQFLADQVLAMSHGGLFDDLAELADKGNVRTLQINSPEQSALNNPNDIRQMMQNLAKSHPDTHFRQVVLPGQTHSLNSAGHTHTTGMLSKEL